MFSGAVLFYLVTLPVEFNASNRALINLNELHIVTDKEMVYSKKMLFAAALTYVASALTAIGSLLRLLLITKSNKRQR